MKNYIALLLFLLIGSLSAQQTQLDIRQIKPLPLDHFMVGNGTTNVTLERTAANIKFNPADGTWSVSDVKAALDANRSAITALQSGGSDGVVDGGTVTGTNSKILTLTRTVGPDVTIPFTDLVDDADNSISNEIQSFTLNGTGTVILGLTPGGNTVGFTGAGGNTVSQVGSTITITAPPNNDNSAINEVQTFSRSGNTTSLSLSGGSINIVGGGATTVTASGTGANSIYTISSTDNVNDADASQLNEIQTLETTANTNTLTLSLGGGTTSRNDEVTEFAFKPTSGSTITLPNAPPAGTDWIISLNGIVQRRVSVSSDTPDISVSGTTVTFNYWTFSAGDVVTGTVGKN